jgi:cytochrome P450
VPDRRDFPHASLIEGLRFTAQVAIPNVIQGLLRRRPKAVAAATLAGADGLAIAFMRSLRRSYGDGPVWIRAGKDEALLLLGAEPIRRVLEHSPHPYAADPEPKRSGMRHFQPQALTISRQPEWAPRRRFAEAVLDTGRPVHRLGDQFASICLQEAQRLPSSLDWEHFNEAIRRITRRIVLGDGAAEDRELTRTLGELMDRSNPPARGDPALRSRLLAQLNAHLDRREAYSLAGVIRDAPETPDTDPAEQVIHWLFALGDTLATNAYRCLAVLAAEPGERGRVLAEIDRADPHTGHGIADLPRLYASLNETMRLWPTTPVLSRITTEAIDWDGIRIPKDTQLLIVNTFNHRDELTVPYANQFAPDQWLTGDAAERWSFNHFSHGPQVCPGIDLALFVGAGTIAGLLRERTPRLTAPKLSLKPPVPYALDAFAIRIEFDPR